MAKNTLKRRFAFVLGVQRELVLMLVLFGLGTTQVVAQSLVRIEFLGSINSVDAGPFGISDVITGQLTVDVDAVATFVGFSPPQANFFGAVTNFSIEGRDIETLFTQTIYQGPGLSSDSSIAFTHSGIDSDTGQRGRIELRLEGSSLYSSPFAIANLFSLDLADLDVAEFAVALPSLSSEPKVEAWSGTLSALSVTTVPLPSGAILLGSVIWLVPAYRFASHLPHVTRESKVPPND